MPSNPPVPALVCLAMSLTPLASAEWFEWSQLPPLPDAEGFASPFAGVSNGALLVGGGANIPENKWADVFSKVWYDRVFVWEPANGHWITGPKLPRALGYGVSITAEDSVLCFGGSDATRHYADSFRMKWSKGRLDVTPLPPLPRPCAHACGALLGRVLYLAGGTETPESTRAMHNFWALDLEHPSPVWKELPPWPGPARMLATAGTSADSFYLFSGATLRAGPDGKPVRTYLKDAYRFTPATGWTRASDLPRAAVAAPSPAVHSTGRLLVFSGDDGEQVTFRPLEKHPGFPRTILAYDTAADAWSTLREEVPFSRVTVPVVRWNHGFVFPNGEVRPRERTPQVWFAREKPDASQPRK
jgi:N-acetylneuraminic acid mutarotase